MPGNILRVCTSLGAVLVKYWPCLDQGPWGQKPGPNEAKCHFWWSDSGSGCSLNWNVVYCTVGWCLAWIDFGTYESQATFNESKLSVNLCEWCSTACNFTAGWLKSKWTHPLTLVFNSWSMAMWIIVINYTMNPSLHARILCRFSITSGKVRRRWCLTSQ